MAIDAASADDHDIAAGNCPSAATLRVSSYIAKLGVTSPEQLSGHYPGYAMLSGSPHVLMDPEQQRELMIVCKRCSTLYTTGGFESHCNVRESKGSVKGWCVTKNKDRSSATHNLNEDEGYPKTESLTFWKGMYENVDRGEPDSDTDANVYVQTRGDVMAYVVAPTGNLRVICIPCLKSLSLNKVKKHIQEVHTGLEYSELRCLQPFNRAGKFLPVLLFCFALNKENKPPLCSFSPKNSRRAA